MRYADLADEQQVEILRRAALAAVPEFGLAPTNLTLVLHGYNTTFRLDAIDGRTAAVRVNTNSHSRPANVAAQHAWQHAIAAETDVRVPDPWLTLAGEYAVTVPSDGYGGPLTVTVSSWLAGPDIGRPDPKQAHALGVAMATLHTHAEGWSMPPQAALPMFDEPLFGDENLLTGVLDMPGRDVEVIASSMATATAGFAAAYTGAGVFPLHADLHGGNLKWDEGRLAVFDFDDAGMGIPLLDLAVATFYLRDAAGVQAEEALRDGYASVRALPDDRHLEPLIAARQLLLANALLSSTTSAFRKDALPYLAVTVRRLASWFDSGRFRLDA